MNQLSTNQRRIAAWAGIIGPVLFLTIFTIEGLIRPGYSTLKMYVSALSLGPRGWTQIANFLVFGMLLFAFTRGVAAEFQNGKASRGGLVLLTIIAACYFISGPFVMDPTGTPMNLTTVHGTIHGIAGAIVFVLMPVSCFVYLRRFRIDPKWRSMWWWTLLLGTVSAAGSVLLTLFTKFPDLQNMLINWLGLIQRTAIIPFMVWVFIFGLESLKRVQPA
jgi:hypothetical membrane protein